MTTAGNPMSSGEMLTMPPGSSRQIGKHSYSAITLNRIVRSANRIRPHDEAVIANSDCNARRLAVEHQFVNWARSLLANNTSTRRGGYDEVPNVRPRDPGLGKV